MANMTFKTNLLPNSTSGEYSLGSSEQYWNIYGKVNNLNIHYGVCETSAATATKAVTCDTFSADDLTTGAIVYVTFTNTNTTTASNLTLSVNGTTAKPIKYQYNASATASLPGAGYLIANQTYAFTYNGTNWVTRDIHYNTDTNTYMRTYVGTTDKEYPIAALSSSTTANVFTTTTYNNAYGMIASTASYRATINPNTGVITVPNGVKTDTILAPTTSNGTTYGIGTSGQALVSNGSAMYWGDVTPPLSNTAAESLGTASAGTSTSVARADHVHPLPAVGDLENDVGYMTGMTFLSYGNSTWQNFIDAYSDNKVVYCRASSNGNPSTGSQNRLAFMAYVNNIDPTQITEVEFQYYRSMNSHDSTNQGDQVFVYKLNKKTGWSVITRNTYTKIIPGTGLSGTFTTGNTPTVTLDCTLAVPEASTATPQNLGTAATGTSTAYAREDHVHEKPTYGNISTSGAITSTAAISNGDRIAIIDLSDNNKLTGSSIAFGTSGDWFLNNSGTWSQLATSLEPLTLFGQSYDGTTPLEIKLEDLGLSVSNTGMEFKGVVTTNVTNGDTTSVLTLTDGTTLSNPQSGWVILDNQNEQFVWSNGAWTAMGLASIYALQNHIHGYISSGGLLTNTTGTVNSGDYLVIADGIDGKIKKSEVTFSAVSTCADYYLNGQGAWSHPVTSVTIKGTTGQINVDNSSAITTAGTRTISLSSGVITTTGNYGLAENYSPSFGSGFYVPYFTVDTYGRLTSAVNNTLTIPNTTATSTVTGLMDSATYTSAYNVANSYVSAGSGIAIDVTDNFGTTSGQRLIVNAGVRSIGTSGDTLWVDTNGSSTGITVPYASTATTASTATYDSSGNIIASTYVLKSGDTMTGDLTAQKAGDVYFRALNTSTSAAIYLDAGSSTKSGLWSNGYYNGTSFTSSGIWVIYRGSDGEAHTDLKLYGAVWNDYAEYRKDNPEESELQKPGRCVRELGNGQLTLTTERLQRGCEIISDTYGFAIGRDMSNGYNTPIASNGRVLAYILEGREEAKKHIGYPVCSGPNGTVSIMTHLEEVEHPSCIIGTISEVPDYEEWGTGKVKVNNRIWIRIR